MKHAPHTLWIINPAPGPHFSHWQQYLQGMPHLRIHAGDHLPPQLTDIQTVITVGTAPGNKHHAEPLTHFVVSGGTWLHMADSDPHPLPAIFGAQPQTPGPWAEIRVCFKDADHPMAVRLADTCYLTQRFQPLQVTQSDTETVLEADWHFIRQPVLTCRRAGQGHAACTTLQALDQPDLQRILYRLLHHLNTATPTPSLGVGILGYAPSVGRSHGLGCRATPGLTLQSVCDLNPGRLRAARQDFATVRCHAEAAAMAGDAEVDLVIVATPPNTHAALCLEMMAAGKHVVCEKPLALNRRETDALADMAANQGVHLSCHQNRRFDEDFRVIQAIVAQGRIGELFYMESFVGGFGHPCGHWHSHEPVSGGAAYDWGGHYLDWIVALMPGEIAHVTGTRHKRVWHDITNADQERIQITFRDGREAEFIHSDIAAIRKPKWYLLGTRGALIGEWRDTIVYHHDPDQYYLWDEIPASEMPPRIRIHRRRSGGEIEVIEPALKGTHAPIYLPQSRDLRHGFHYNLADHLLTGEPLAAPLQDSIRVVHILEAAERSMQKGGSRERLA